jgi:hypothetical protein
MKIKRLLFVFIIHGFININDMYNNDVGKGGAQGCEAYEVK